jgi:hypothetical protein
MPYLALGLTLVGYALLMRSNPVRSSFGDGWRCLRRYSVLWRTLAWMALANALFLLAVRFTDEWRSGIQPMLMRPGWTDAGAWLKGTPDSLWWLPASSVRATLEASVLPACEMTAGLFNNVVTTFPLAVFAALGLLLNRRRTLVLLGRALWRRFGVAAWLLLPLILACALATMAKAVLYFRPPWAEMWMQWGPAVAAASAVFEYLFGVGIQAYLILHAYAWVRGLSFEPNAMREVAIRRLGAASKWAGIVLCAQMLLIELPLVGSFYFRWPGTPDVVTAHLQWVRYVLAGLLLVFLSMQAWLTLHGETLKRAWQAHWCLVRRHWWAVSWFVVVAFVHCFALQFFRAAVARGVGDETVPGIVWAILWPWIFGLVAGWLLASWVCLFKRCE